MRLIDADALNRAIADSRISLHSMHLKMRVPDILLILKSATIIDAVPVVRCKDCKWWGLPEGMYATKNVKHCEVGRYMVAANGYCVYGEVKDDAD